MPVVTAPVLGTPCWVDLSTSDLPGAINFYGRLLGWSFVDQGADFGHYHMAAKNGHHAAGLGPMQPGGSPVPAWTVYIATANVHQSVQQVTEHGGSVLAPPMDVGNHGRMAIVADPSGAVVGLWQALEHHGVGFRGEPGGLAWAEVNTRDGEGVAAFFSKLTGHTVQKMPEMAYWTLHTADGQPHYGVLQMTTEWGDMPPHWMPYFAVASADATAEKVVELGGKVHHGPFDTPHGRILICADPQGAAITFIQVPSQK